eukprot:764499-Hanusia_phi.AAC.6
MSCFLLSLRPSEVFGVAFSDDISSCWCGIGQLEQTYITRRSSPFGYVPVFLSLVGTVSRESKQSCDEEEKQKMRM